MADEKYLNPERGAYLSDRGYSSAGLNYLEGKPLNKENLSYSIC